MLLHYKVVMHYFAFLILNIVFMSQVDVSFHFLDINLLESRSRKKVCLYVDLNLKLSLQYFCVVTYE